jgi:hypothetical protein
MNRRSGPPYPSREAVRRCAVASSGVSTIWPAILPSLLLGRIDEGGADDVEAVSHHTFYSISP